MRKEQFPLQMPDPFYDEDLPDERLEPSLLGAVTTNQSEENSFIDYINQENERLSALKKEERVAHLRRGKNAGQFVFRHKVASITGAVVLTATVGSRLLHKK